MSHDQIVRVERSAGYPVCPWVRRIYYLQGGVTQALAVGRSATAVKL